MRQLVGKCFDVKGLVVVESRMGLGRQLIFRRVGEEVHFRINECIKGVDV